MRPIFTIHAGEYLVGCQVEKKLKGINVWVPTKDTGVDLLLTNGKSKKMVSLQVKFSKSFLETSIPKSCRKGLKSCGWWTLNRDKLKNSKADFWVLALYGFGIKQQDFIVIRPGELYEKLVKLRGNVKTMNLYLWVTEKKQCWETRGLNKSEYDPIPKGAYSNPEREFTKFLESWKPVEDWLKK
jgi:hypothetical protein